MCSSSYLLLYCGSVAAARTVMGGFTIRLLCECVTFKRHYFDRWNMKNRLPNTKKSSFLPVSTHVSSGYYAPTKGPTKATMTRESFGSDIMFILSPVVHH